MKIVSYNSERFSDTLSASSSTLRSRMLAADTAVSIGMKNPVFGTGAGGYRYFQQEAQAPLLLSKPYYSFINTPYAHNDYLQIFSEYGGFGLALFLAVVFSVFYKFVVSSRKICDYEYLLGSAFICCAAACLVESFFNFPLSVMPSAALFWFFMGCVYRMSLEPEDAPLKMPKQSAALSKAILAFVLVILAAIAVLKPSGLISNFYLKYALNRDSKNRPDMDYYYSKAIRLAPDSYNVLYYYAISRVKVLDYPEAMKYFNKSLAIYPYSCDAFFNMGNAAYKAGDLKTAEDALLKAEDLYPDFSAVHLILSKIYEGTGRSALAKEEFLKVRRENPGRMEELTGSEIIYLREITATGR
jgi:tetratricopeptide (TPR) repeat protein